MPLPDDFSPYEHLQSTFIRSYNKEVKNYFKDLDPDDLDPDITIPRQSLYIACKITDNDTAAMVQMRMFMYYFVLRRAADMQTPIYGIPLPDLQASRKFKPQITLKFREDLADVEEGYEPVWGEISFRLMNEESNTITKTELITLGNKIKTIFGVGNGKVWRKGKKMFSYTDKAKGYQFQILAREKTDAKDLISDVLDIQNDTPDWRKFKSNETGDSSSDELSAYPYTPPNITIFGEVQKEPRRRPNVNVRFMWAEVAIWGKPRAIILYDHSFTHFDGLVD